MRIVSQQEMHEAGPMIVGIVGGSGSGKSWLAQHLLEGLGPSSATVVCQDAFYKDLSHLTPAGRAEVNFDHPESLDWAAFGKVIKHLASGRPAAVPSYDFATHSRREEQIFVEPRPIVIFEGLWLFHRSALRRFFQFAIFIEAEAALCLERRRARDVAERGRCSQEVTAWYGERVLPMQRQFVDPQRLHADLLLTAPVNVRDARHLTERISIMHKNYDRRRD